MGGMKMNHRITQIFTRKKLKMSRIPSLLLISLIADAMAIPAVAQLADTPWPMFHHDLNHTGLSSHYGPDTATVKWIFTTGGKIYGSAAIGADGTIYIGTRDYSHTTDSKLYALYPNGTEKWNWTPPTGKCNFIDSTPAVASDGTIYVGSWNRRLYALNPDGTKKWEFPTPCGGFVYSSPAIAPDGTIYIGNNNHKLYAIYPNGTEKWSYSTKGAIQSSPAVGPDGTIYVGSYDGNLYAINPNGSLKWKYTVGMTKSSPAIGSDGTIYVGSYSKKLYAINPDGSLKWTYPTGCWIVSSPAIGSDGTIYVGSYDGKLYAINTDGSLKWAYTTGGGISSSPAIDADGTIYVGSRDGHVYAINPNGTLLWKYYTGNRIHHSSPAIASDGTVYIGNCGGNLYAFGPGAAPCKPAIEVNKTVWNGTAWVEKIEDANVGQTYRFRCEVYNNGTCCNLTDIRVVDTLSDGLEYVSGSGTPFEPNWTASNQLGWNFTEPLATHEKMVIEFDANVTGCGNHSNILNASAYCTKTDEWVSDEDDAWVNVSDGTVCGYGDWEDDPVNPCKERREIKRCMNGTCSASGEYEYRNKPDGTDCGTDYYDDPVKYCNGDEIWEHQLFHDFYCEEGNCTEHTSWVNDSFVQNCSDNDGWYDTGNTTWITDPANECREKEQKEQEYRDYTCFNGSCIHTVTDTRWIDTGNYRDKPGTPAIDVEKTVWNGTAWVKKIYANVGDIVRFNSTIHNNGTCCNLTNITVMDTLSDSFEYTGVEPPTPAPVVIHNPDGTTTLKWNIPGPITPSETVVFLIRANVTECGENWNKQNATAEACGEIVYDEDFAYVNARAAIIRISVEPEPVTVYLHDQFEVNISVDPQGNPVYSVQYDLSFNASVLHAWWQNEGDFLKQGGASTNIYANTIDNTNGKITFGATRVGDVGGATEPGTLAVIGFTAIKQGASSNLTLSNVIATDTNAEEIAVDITDSSVSVEENKAPVAKAKSMHKYNNVGEKYLSKAYFNASESYDRDGNSIIYYGWAFGDGNTGTGETVEHVYTSWKWNGTGYDPFEVCLTVTDDGEPPLDNTTCILVNVYIAGDANGDGVVNILDATMVGLRWYDSCECGDYCWEGQDMADRADLNNDCKVNI
ncbi:MAG: hypothetical protein DRO11_04860, partial [Methanobacteriota archaeon]